MASKRLSKKTFFLILLSASLFFITKKTSAQYPYTVKISYPEQLPTPIIYDMIADKKGYIWLGTDKGLIKFNGLEFKIIEFDKTSLKSVSYLQEDDNGVIWCRNFYNEIFYLKNDSLHKLKLNISGINGVVSSGEFLWVSTPNKIIKINIQNKETLKIFNKNGSELIAGIFYSYGRLIVISIFSNVWVIENDSIILEEKSHHELQGNPLDIIQDKENVIISPKSSLSKSIIYLNKKNKVNRLPLPQILKQNNLFKTCITAENEYWLCTQEGGWKWDPFTGKTKLFFPSIAATKIIKDYQGNYWISTLDEGLIYCPSLKNNIYRIQDTYSSNNATRIALLKDGKFVLGSTKGDLAFFDAEKQTGFLKNINQGIELEVLQYDSTQNLIFLDIGTLNSNYKFKKTIDLGKRIAFDPWGNIISAQHNKSIIINPEFEYGKIIPSSSNHLYHKLFSNYNNIKIQYGHEKYIFLSLRDIRATYVLTDKQKKKFWISYEDDLYEYHYNGTIKIIKSPNGNPIIGKHLFLQNDSTLLVSSSTNGLYVIENGKVINHFTVKEGLPSNQLKKTIWYEGKYWIANSEGLDVLDPVSRKSIDLLSINGLDKMIINDFEIKNGYIWMATHQGVLKLPTILTEKNIPILFSMLQLKVKEEFYLNNSKLRWNQNNIEFEVEALHFKGPSELNYHFRLNDVNKEWSITNGYSKYIIFNALPPGNYTFEIFAQDINKNYKSEIQNFKFTITKPFWLTAWFALLALLTFIYLIYLLFRWRIRIVRKNLKTNELFLQSRLMALRAQMNPHFVFNILNTVQGLIYSNQKKEAGNVLGNFSDLMRKTLIASEKQNITLNEEIANLDLYLQLEKARFETDFEYSISKTKIHDHGNYIPSLLIQPFVENAVKHGLLHKQGIKKLDIHFEELENFLIVAIEDNGVGRKKSAEINEKNKSKPESFATKNITNRVSIFNKMNRDKIEINIIDKTDQLGKSTGTKVQMKIPFMFL